MASSGSDKIVIGFDLYGTLLSTDSIMGKLGSIYDKGSAASLATSWRRYQLEYTWRINSMGEYRDFSKITRSALEHAVAEHGFTLKEDEIEDLMRSYDALHVFPEIPAAMKLLEANRDRLAAYAFSNGTTAMVENSVRTSPELGPLASTVFQSLITVDSIRCFKPDPRTYEHLIEVAGKTGQPGDVWVVSANPFDIAGARAAGLRAAFIDRPGKGWMDRLVDEKRAPSVVARSVDEAVQSIIDFEG
ncbi:haloacid dehalogenase [Xylariaceae sp. FL0255]|nr:haloacid dehalogenase [Xylariaceae sp. FL0255]